MVRMGLRGGQDLFLDGEKMPRLREEDKHQEVPIVIAVVADIST